MTGSDDSPARQGERLARRLARAGVASRRAAEEIIAAGRVRVNGRIVSTPAFNVGPTDRVELDGLPVAEPEPARLWRYHKPVGLVTSEADEKGRPTVFSRLPAGLPRVLSVGRLDLNSEGLLLLTNDGDLKRRLELPSTGWLRKYRVRVHGEPTPEALAPLARGMVIEGERFQPMTFTIDRQQGANAWLTVALREGRNREVRRALSECGFDVSRLIRVSYGPFQLGDLGAGEVEEVRPKVLRDQLGMAPDPKEERPRRGRAPAPEGPRRLQPESPAKPRGRSADAPGSREPAPAPREPKERPPRRPSGEASARTPSAAPAAPPRKTRGEGWAKARPPAGRGPRKPGPKRGG